MEEASLASGTIVANNYRVTTPLGAGGMGTVYLADNLTLKQRVVVKVLRGAQVGAGHEEAQLLASMQHPNVVTVYAHDPAHDLIVMEYLDGTSLSKLLERGIDRVNAIRVGLTVAEALAAVHKRGLVHRDIKPDNVMLALNTSGGRLVDWLKLIDFGTALKVGKAPPSPIGTPEFCPPEQFQAGTPAHPANDVYALGVTLFLLLTGRFPYEGEPAALYRQHSTAPRPQLVETLVGLHGDAAFDPRTRALLEDLDDLLQRMMAVRLEERPTASDVARTLTRLESSFADAGTYVGSVSANTATFQSLAPVRQRALVTAGRNAPVASPAGTPISERDTQERPAHDPRRRRSSAGTPAVPDASSPTTERTATLLEREASPTERSATLPEAPGMPSGSRLPTAHEMAANDDDGGKTRKLQLILGAVVMLLALALGVQILTSTPGEGPAKPPAVTTPPPVATPTPTPEPAARAGRGRRCRAAGANAGRDAYTTPCAPRRAHSRRSAEGRGQDAEAPERQDPEGRGLHLHRAVWRDVPGRLRCLAEPGDRGAEGRHRGPRGPAVAGDQGP
jgi:serine/threonine-protein kinase